MRARPLYYAWYDPKGPVYRLSRLPPDAPVRPSIPFQRKSELMEMLDKRKARVMWLPELPSNLPDDLSSIASRQVL